jgi:hypothetical protein
MGQSIAGAKNSQFFDTFYRLSNGWVLLLHNIVKMNLFATKVAATFIFQLLKPIMRLNSIVL